MYRGGAGRAGGVGGVTMRGEGWAGGAPGVRFGVMGEEMSQPQTLQVTP